MTAQPSDLYDLLNKIRYDTTAIQAKVTDALAILADLHLEEREVTKCPKCNIPLSGPRRLAEHLENVHA
jgi:hypothetical protein